MSNQAGALSWAEAQVAAVRDDPAVGLALMARLFRGPTGRAPRHLPFRRAALSFMRWQADRGVLNPLDASPPGSVWWREMNERLLRDGCEAIGLLGGLTGEPSSQAVRLWLTYSASPTGRNWYRAHNASIVAGAFLSLRRVLPHRYPLEQDVQRYIFVEQRLGRMLDYAVIVPRLQRLFEWSAEELGEPRLRELVRDGNPIYAWPYEQRHVWRSSNMPFAAGLLERVTRAR